jgi:hypothetical protein
MDFLEKQFIEQITASIDTFNNLVVIGRLAFSPSDILQKFDDEGYAIAFEEWKEETWLPGILLRADEIIEDFDNRNRFAEVLEAIKKDRVIPFVGSGMSQPSGFPLWRDFLYELRARSTLSMARLTEILDSGDYELAATEIYQNMPPKLFDERLENTFRIRVVGEINGAVRFLPEIFTKDIITLNYDNLLEVLFAASKNPFNVVLAGERLADLREISSKGEKCLVKYHGDLVEPRTRILTTDEYEKRYTEDLEIRDSLIELYRNNKLLFVGCSLSADRTMSIFKEISELDKKTPRHFALLKVPEKEDDRIQREHFLTERSIFPIWYDGEHDESIEALFVKILKDTGIL